MANSLRNAILRSASWAQNDGQQVVRTGIGKELLPRHRPMEIALLAARSNRPLTVPTSGATRTACRVGAAAVHGAHPSPSTRGRRAMPLRNARHGGAGRIRGTIWVEQRNRVTGGTAIIRLRVSLRHQSCVCCSDPPALLQLRVTASLQMLPRPRMAKVPLLSEAPPKLLLLPRRQKAQMPKGTGAARPSSQRAHLYQRWRR